MHNAGRFKKNINLDLIFHLDLFFFPLFGQFDTELGFQMLAPGPSPNQTCDIDLMFSSLESCMRNVASRWTRLRKSEISNLSLLGTRSYSTSMFSEPTLITENRQNLRVGFYCTVRNRGRHEIRQWWSVFQEFMIIRRWWDKWSHTGFVSKVQWVMIKFRLMKKIAFKF